MGGYWNTRSCVIGFRGGARLPRAEAERAASAALRRRHGFQSTLASTYRGGE